jgi:hypothetical protein
VPPHARPTLFPPVFPLYARRYRSATPRHHA